MKKIFIVATGGTIQMKKEADRGIVPSFFGEDVFKGFDLPQDDFKLEFDEFSNVPSPWITPEDMMRISNRIKSLALNCDGIIITHGTDTLEETAFFLSLTYEGDVPVVLTAAMRAAPDLGIDGPRNIFDSVKVVLNHSSRKRGVMVVINNSIFSPRDVVKVSTSNLAAFTSPEHGLMGTIDEKVIFFSRTTDREYIPTKGPVIPVDIIPTYSGSDGRFIKESVNSGARGIVLEALGRGNVPPSMIEGISQAIFKGIPVVVSTKVQNGRVAPTYGYDGGGKHLAGLGCFFAGNLRANKARIKLMLALGSEEKKMEGYFEKHT
ncbi:asparaginase [candidate division WOR-3 bacterium]|nr:asparaginase [candidate division WOR-3 bacterium]